MKLFVVPFEGGARFVEVAFECGVIVLPWGRVFGPWPGHRWSCCPRCGADAHKVKGASA